MNDQDNDPIYATALKYASPEEDCLMSAKKVAEHFGLKLCTVYKLAQRGRIPGYKIYARRRFKLSEVEEALKNR